jgi:lysophospholipase L1-like esterase
MKQSIPLLACLAVQCAAAPAAEQIVTLGDSLTFAYEAEFCFSQPITGFGVVGDGFPLTVRNWIEILSDPAYRGSHFELGTRDSITVSHPFNIDPPFTKYFRQAHNWAIPGLKVDGLRRFLTGEATFRDLLDDDPSFTVIDQLFDNSDYTNADFALSDLQSQIQNTAEKMVIFVGGNDIREVCSTIYNGGSAGTFVADFMADMVAILNIVQGLNPNLKIVLVNVPHVGITPKIRQENSPLNLAKVENVAAVLRDLNNQLAALATSRNIGYADVYTPTVHMANGSTYPLVIHGIICGNASNANGGQGNVWLGKGTTTDLSDDFHPNTNAQALIANEIIHAFNRAYQTGIAPLTATEILGGLMARTTTDIDMTFTTWHDNFFKPAVSAPAAGAADDSDGDGINAGTEFALGLNPRLRDAEHVRHQLTGGMLELSYPLRLTTSTRFTLMPEAATDFNVGFAPFGPAPSPGPDGLARAAFPAATPKAFLRLKTTILP